MCRSWLPWLFVCAAVARAQVSAYVPDNAPALGVCNSIPFGVTSQITYLARIPASSLGGVAGRHLLDVAFAPCGTGTWSSASVIVGVGHVPTPQPCPFTFPSSGGTSIGSFADFTVVWDSSVRGPLTWNAVQDTWSPLGLGGTGFLWDGVRDIGFFLTSQAPTFGAGFSGACHKTTSEPARTHSASFWAPASTLTSCTVAAGLKMRLDFVPLQAQWQVNGPGASLDIDGVSSSPYVQMEVTSCTNQPHVANLVSSTTVGNVWNVVLTTGPGVPLFGGGIPTAGGQIVNVDFADPSLILLFPPGTPNAFAVGAVPLSFPQAFDTSAQMFVMDAAAADGFDLSALTRLHVATNVQSLPGPTGEDTYVTVGLGTPQLCGSSPVSFYGSTYTLMHVSANGRVMFGAPNTDYLPSPALAVTESSWAGLWCDLSPTAGGAISISTTPAGAVRVDYVGVPYFGEPANPVTFAIEIDPILATVTIDGLWGVPLSSTGLFAMLGVSPGFPLATDPGAINLVPGGPSPGPAGGAMLYALGVPGLFTSGLASVVFVPNAIGNYDFTVF